MGQTTVDTDLTFFTNLPDASLRDRFVSTLPEAQYFDVLVGYFRISGFHQLYEAMEEIEKIRMLVGINVGQRSFEAYEAAQQSSALAHGEARDEYLDHVTAEMEGCEDGADVERGIRTFIDWLDSGKLELRVFPRGDIHAKVYVSRFPEDHMDFGRVITGSSNFSQSGLEGRREFNVELKDRSDVEFALEQFESLWSESVDVTEDFVETVHQRTWLNDDISPYELYLKFLYEYFREDINVDREFDTYLPEEYVELQYQKDAVATAQKMLDSYGGVFLADVVGLGKTFIAALLAQQLRGQKLILCPPVLVGYWRETFRKFGVQGYRVLSHGKLDQLYEKDYDQFDHVFVDEAHRYRNEATISFDMLNDICTNKNVILVSATPLNNTEQDIYSQLKLFQIPKHSDIPGVSNLKRFFTRLKSNRNQYKKGQEEYFEALEENSEEIRDKVLKHVMVRRTRSEVEEYYDEDLEEQGVTFPEVEEPHRLIYEFTPDINDRFHDTLSKLKEMEYARYAPLLYLEEPEEEFVQQSQRNIRGFMKSIIVKRLESSFHAFRKTLGRFIDSYENFLEMYEEGTIYISRDVKVNELWDRDDEEELLRLVEEDEVTSYSAEAFVDRFVADMRTDLQLLREIGDLWEHVDRDPKLEKLRTSLREDETLSDGPLILFTEFSETGNYLYERLNEDYPGEVLFYSSNLQRMEDRNIGEKGAKEEIKRNFDPNYPDQSDQLRILITTDVLSEGMNLHRSNTVMNYDLPWNPTKVLQRVGRVNRIGTDFDTIHIFNFFPTEKTDEHLKLEPNIKGKIQSFHDTLGEDAKYLTEDEEVSSHNLFGDHLYEKLNDPDLYQGNVSDERSELEYLETIREIRDERPDLFEKVKRLPKKARTARRRSDLDRDTVLTFFRRGRLKKFFLSGSTESEELTFFQAVDWFECEEHTSKQDVPASDYYTHLNQNKEAFRESTTRSLDGSRSGGRSNEQVIIEHLKGIQKHRRFTEEDERYIRDVIDIIDLGILSKQKARTLKNHIEEEPDPINVLQSLQDNIPSNQFDKLDQIEEKESQPREIILSEYFHGGSS